MGYTNGRILAPVSIYDVARALSKGSNDLGTLCQANELNKWATFKPYPNGNVATLLRDESAPYGIRTIYNRVNPSTGAVSPSNNTTLKSAVEALLSALASGTANPFLDDMAMYVKPAGGAGKAFRLTDFVTTQSVRGSQQQRGQAAIHGYKPTAILRFGYHDTAGAYHGLQGRALSVDSDNNIVADGNQYIDQTVQEIWGETYYNLDTRLGWNNRWSDEENSLCVLDWLDAKWSIQGASLHRAVVLFTNDWTDQTGFVAVGTIPWASGGTWANAIMGDATRRWYALEFLTDATPTTSDFITLDTWQNNYSMASWYIIPGLLSKDLFVKSNDPYLIGAEFTFADVNQFSPYGLNLYFKVRNMALQTSLTVFLSDVQRPNAIHDYALNSNTGLTITATGSYNLYANNVPMICPSDVTTTSYRKFNEVFVVGQTYYLCFWGKATQSDSGSCILSLPIVATAYDSFVAGT